MQETAEKAWDTSGEDALGLWLRKAVREGAYTEEYCTKLEAYEKVTKNEAAVLYFTARLAFALGEMEEAYRLAHEAYARRKLSHKVWQLLFEIGDALGLDEEAVFFKSLCQQNMAIRACRTPSFAACSTCRQRPSASTSQSGRKAVWNSTLRLPWGSSF